MKLTFALSIFWLVLVLPSADGNYRINKIENFLSSNQSIASVNRVWQNDTSFEILIEVKVPVKSAHVNDILLTYAEFIVKIAFSLI